MQHYSTLAFYDVFNARFGSYRREKIAASLKKHVVHAKTDEGKTSSSKHENQWDNGIMLLELLVIVNRIRWW